VVELTRELNPRSIDTSLWFILRSNIILKLRADTTCFCF